MPQVNYTASTEPQCRICNNEFLPNQPTFSHTSPDSLHFFHPDCILNHLAFLPQPNCPVCQLNITHINGSPIQRTFASVSHALDRVLASGNIDEFRTFLANGYIAVETRGKLLVSATDYQSLDIINAVLGSGDIEELDLGDAVLVGAENDSLAIVCALLNHGAISDPDRGLAVAKAARNDNLAMIVALLATGAIPEEECGEAREEAVANGNQQMVTALDEHRLFHDESDPIDNESVFTG